MSHMGPSPSQPQQFHRAHRLPQRTTLPGQRRDPTFYSKGQCYTCTSSHISLTSPSSIFHQKVWSLREVEVEVEAEEVEMEVELEGERRSPHHIDHTLLVSSFPFQDSLSFEPRFHLCHRTRSFCTFHWCMRNNL